RLHAADSAPRKREVRALLICRLPFGNDCPVREGCQRPRACLKQKSASHPLVVECLIAPLRLSFQHAKIFLAAKDLERIVAERRSDNALYKETRYRLCSLGIDGNRE